MTEEPVCRWCAHPELDVVLDLGRQPAADHFPLPEDGVEPRWPLRMGLCERCGLAQLVEDPGVADEPRGVEPRALVDQAREAVAQVVEAGLVAPGRRIREFDSPHGGSWRALLTRVGAVDATDTDDEADLVVDVFGLMHEADQREALGRRVAALAPGGTLLLQFHSLASIVRQRQWNALRHGHWAYYATDVLAGLLVEVGLTPRRAWTFELYGGTVLLAADAHAAHSDDPVLDALLAGDRRAAVRSTAGLAPLAAAAADTAAELTAWLGAHRDAGRRVIGYGAASRAVPLLVRSGVGVDLLPAVADASTAKHGRCLPVSRIPIMPAETLRSGAHDVVLVFVPDLLDEVRAAFPEVLASGGTWAVSEPRPHLV